VLDPLLVCAVIEIDDPFGLNKKMTGGVAASVVPAAAR